MVAIVFALHVFIIVPNKDFFSQKVLIFFLFLQENICGGYLLEVPHRGASNEHPQHVFSNRNTENINTFGLKKKHLIKSYMTNKCNFGKGG